MVIVQCSDLEVQVRAAGVVRAADEAGFEPRRGQRFGGDEGPEPALSSAAQFRQQPRAYGFQSPSFIAPTEGAVDSEQLPAQ